MDPQASAIQVKEIMTPDPIRVGEDIPVEAIYELFAREQLNCVPVVDLNNRIQGCITLSDLQKSRQLFDLREFLEIIISSADDQARDYLNSSFAFLEGPIDLKAREVMSVNPILAKPTDNLLELSRKMMEKQTHHAMVLNEEDQLVGIVSTFDFLKLFSTKSGGAPPLAN